MQIMILLKALTVAVPFVHHFSRQAARGGSSPPGLCRLLLRDAIDSVSVHVWFFLSFSFAPNNNNYVSRCYFSFPLKKQYRIV